MTDIYPVPKPRQKPLPPKKTTHEGTNGKVKIIIPADPEKVAAYRAHKKRIADKREAGGLNREQEGYYRG